MAPKLASDAGGSDASPRSAPASTWMDSCGRTPRSEGRPRARTVDDFAECVDPSLVARSGVAGLASSAEAVQETSGVCRQGPRPGARSHASRTGLASPGCPHDPYPGPMRRRVSRGARLHLARTTRCSPLGSHISPTGTHSCASVIVWVPTWRRPYVNCCRCPHFIRLATADCAAWRSARKERAAATSVQASRADSRSSRRARPAQPGSREGRPDRRAFDHAPVCERLFAILVTWASVCGIPMRGGAVEQVWGRALKWPTHSGAIGAVVARFVHTEEVTGSNPVSPTLTSLRFSSGGTFARQRWL